MSSGLIPLASRKPAPIDRAVARFALKVRRSRIHRLGVFASEEIPRLKYVIEYSGRRIRMRDKDRELSMPGRPKRILSMRLNRCWIVDALVGGSGAEYINHSCDPNLFARKTRKRIFLVSRRRIGRGEELTLDYRVLPRMPRYPCRCGAAKCRGFMNQA